MPSIPGHLRLRQEDPKCEASLDCESPAWAIKPDPAIKLK